MFFYLGFLRHPLFALYASQNLQNVSNGRIPSGANHIVSQIASSSYQQHLLAGNRYSTETDERSSNIANDTEVLNLSLNRDR